MYLFEGRAHGECEHEESKSSLQKSVLSCQVNPGNLTHVVRLGGKVHLPAESSHWPGGDIFKR